MDTFSTRLQAALDERNWGPSDLAAKVSVSDDTIRKWLEGRQPKLADAMEAASVLGKSLDHLAGADPAGAVPAAEVAGLSPDERTIVTVIRSLGVDPMAVIRACYDLPRPPIVLDPTVKQLGAYNFTPDGEAEPPAADGGEERTGNGRRGRGK